MDNMYIEIYEQTLVLKETRKSIQNVLTEIKKAYREKSIYNIVLAARGSSDNACNYFKYLAETHLELPVSLAAPSVITIYGANINYQHSLVIGVSQSGQAEDVLAVMNEAKKQGSLVLSITNNIDSPMAKIADYHLFLNVGIEKSVAATKTFTSELFALASLVNALTIHPFTKEIDSIFTALDQVKENEENIFKMAEQYINVEECYILARGYLYAIAQETALKIQETCYINARAYAISDFHHGPFAVLDQDSHVIILASPGNAYHCAMEMINKMEVTDANIMLVSSENHIVKDINSFLSVPDVHDIVSVFPYIMTMQLFAWKLAHLRGNNPDFPRGLNKITITK